MLKRCGGWEQEIHTLPSSWSYDRAFPELQCSVTCVFTGMSVASVTLASALQVRGEALSEEEIWSLLSLAAERLLEDLRNGKRVFGATESQDTDSKAS